MRCKFGVVSAMTSTFSRQVGTTVLILLLALLLLGGAFRVLVG